MVASDPTNSAVAENGTHGGIEADIRAVGQIAALPAYLDILCDLTGMRFAAVARVTDHSWTVCAVKDEINFGLPVGGTLPVETTLCLESKQCGLPIAFGHASEDLKYKDHHTPRLYKIESYVSVPIVLRNGTYFGNLCAIDPAPADVANPKTIRIFERFAKLVAMSLDQKETSDRDAATISDERVTSELREQFIAILGHDLRNPLQAVYASGEMIERKSSDPALMKELAGRIKTNVKRMSALIDDVLDFARGKLGGGIGIQVDDVTDINSGLLAVVKELQDVQTDREIVAEINVTHKIRCDLGRVQQVTSNLIGNALTHGAPQSPVKIFAHTDENEFVLEVWNDGLPIPPESVSKIFEPFWRNSTSGSRQGLGLGLHICSQIVRAHKGKLSVTSTQADGTRFTARLPLL
ncbi:MAG TPA: GAF domain-containing sensor histidine kinase [Steroidobacteraceae bacterium]|nr:GAF domain-containing sensor histidine kinase [Steroidobacteraceae bacterium]